MAKNILFEALSRIATSALALLCIPFVIRTFGAYGYGVWEAVLACVGFSNVLYTSIGGTILWKVSIFRGEGRECFAKRVGTAGGVLCLCLGAILAGLGFLYKRQIISLLGITPDSVFFDSSQTLLPAMLAIQSLSGCGECLAAAIAGLGYAARAAIHRSIAAVCYYAVMMAVVWLSRDFNHLGIAYCLIGLVAVVFNYAFLSSLVRSAKSKYGGCIFDLSGMVYWQRLFVSQVAGVLRDYGDRLCVAVVGGPGFVAAFSVAYRVASIIGEINRYIYLPLIAEMGRLSLDVKARGELFGVVMVGNSVITCLVLSLAIGVSPVLLNIWLRDLIPPGSLELLLIFVVGTSAQVVITGPPTACCRGLGFPELELRYIVVSLLWNVVLSFVLIWYLSALGKIVATTISLLMGCVYFLGVMRKVRLLPLKPFYDAALVWAIGVFVASVGVVSLLLAWTSMGRICDFLLMIPVCLTLAVVFILLTGLRSSVRESLRYMLRSLSLRN